MNRDRAANSLLAVLPRKAYQLMLPRLEPVTLTFADVLYRPREAIQHVYFPIDCLVSLLTLVEDIWLWKSAWSAMRACSGFRWPSGSGIRRCARWYRDPEQPCA